MKTLSVYLFENTETVERISDIVYNIIKRHFNFDDEHDALIQALGNISVKDPNAYTLYYLFDYGVELKEFVSNDVYRYAVAYDKKDSIRTQFLAADELYKDDDITINGNNDGIMVIGDDIEFIIKYKK